MNRVIKFRMYDEENDILAPTSCIIDLHYPIMQYTGLVDKNGKEIYEGDIFAAFYEMIFKDGVLVNECGYNIYQVIYANGMFCTDESDDLPIGLWIKEDVAACEVIGNIYQNLELLDN